MVNCISICVALTSNDTNPLVGSIPWLYQSKNWNGGIYTGLNKRLVEAGELLGIEILDHIIIGKTEYLYKK